MAHVHLIVTFCLLGYLSFTTELTVGTCQIDTYATKTKEYFDMAGLEGSWYLYGAHTTNGQGKGRLPCTTYKFTQPIPGDITLTVTENVKNNQYSSKTKLSAESNAIYSTEPAAHSESAEGSPEDNGSSGIFAVVDTDYECWAVTYWCQQKKSTDADPVSTVSVFLKNKSEKCLNGKSKRSYENIMAQFTDIDSENIKWQDMKRCKVEESEKKETEQPEKKVAEQPEKKVAEQPEKKEAEQKTDKETKPKKSKQKDQ